MGNPLVVSFSSSQGIISIVSNISNMILFVSLQQLEALTSQNSNDKKKNKDFGSRR